VISNLKSAFPEKSNSEIELLSTKFYKNLADITLESFKGNSMSEKELLERYKVLNPEILDTYRLEKKSIIGIGSHYCNWEWGVLIFNKQFNFNTIGFYKPLSNKFTDRYILKTRAKRGMQLESIHRTKDVFDQNKDIPIMYIMVSDQSPSNIKKAVWVNFLNQDTACLHGPEFYARLFDYPVLFGDVQRVKRGYYNITLSIIETNSKNTSESEITNKFMKKLESIIVEKPENWIWSHKRWKHKRQY
jgi:KDO2-lipid IV(A) lauroyltransferase